MRVIRIAMAQIDPLVGDIAGNTRIITSIIKEAKMAGADLVAFPELVITGYPPEDLLLKPRFIADNQEALAELARQCVGIVAVVGYVGQGKAGKQDRERSLVVIGDGHELYNSAAILVDGRCIANYCKRLLPNYGVFDEARYFNPGRTLPLISLRGITCGINICEDILIPDGAMRDQAMAGAEVIVNINASPFHIGKSRFREQMLSMRARENGVIVTHTNMVGGQDELIFDGNSIIVDQNGEVVARAKAFEEDLLVADLNVEGVARNRLIHGRRKSLARKMAGVIERIEVESLNSVGMRSRITPHMEPALGELEEVYKGLVLGVKDYVRKNGFRKAVFGVSGGVDSALTAVIAVDALGSDNVMGVFMPSPYTSRESAEDAAELSRRLAIEYQTISITPPFE